MKHLRKNIYIYIPFIILILATGILLWYSTDLKRKTKDLRSKRDEIALLASEYQSLRARVSVFENKKTLTKTGGVVEAVDEVFRSIGLGQKVKSVKPLSTQEIKDGIIEEADIAVERVDINEAVNILHRIDTAPMLIVLKGANIKTSFESPEVLNLKLSVSLIKPK